ncbi:MAG: hypothetical protein H7Z71_07355 [Moraxellaceae bacterium]|nr:hypothetical protein [Pseudobdellovibrionaceae bacterium]
MKKSETKPNLLVELTTRKMEAQKSGGATAETFKRFQPNKSRNVNNSNVGPSWGPRKGN